MTMKINLNLFHFLKVTKQLCFKGVRGLTELGETPVVICSVHSQCRKRVIHLYSFVYLNPFKVMSFYTTLFHILKILSLHNIAFHLKAKSLSPTLYCLLTLTVVFTLKK